MQKNLHVELAVNSNTLAKVIKSAPVELDAALFSAVSGGAPRGTWSQEAHTAPKAA